MRPVISENILLYVFIVIPAFNFPHAVDSMAEKFGIWGRCGVVVVV